MKMELKFEFFQQTNSLQPFAELAGGIILARVGRKIHGLGDVDSKLLKRVNVEEIIDALGVLVDDREETRAA
jgi:hypothetical protein